MAKRILVVGNSGSGKSTSIRKLKPEETFIINVEGKDLPFKPQGYTNVDIKAGPPAKGNVASTHEASTIMRIMEYVSQNRPEIKHIIVDDFQYVSMHEFMSKIAQKGFEKFNVMGKNLTDMVSFPKHLREDLKVYFFSHPEIVKDELTGEVSYKAKTLGKLVDNVVTLDGMFSIVLFTEIVKTKEGIEHYFVTQSDGSTTAKTPIGMFNNVRIPNDLSLVNDAIDNFYTIK